MLSDDGPVGPKHVEVRLGTKANSAGYTSTVEH